MLKVSYVTHSSTSEAVGPISSTSHLSPLTSYKKKRTCYTGKHKCNKQEWGLGNFLLPLQPETELRYENENENDNDNENENENENGNEKRKRKRKTKTITKTITKTKTKNDNDNDNS